MWPKSRPPTASYHPLRDIEGPNVDSNQSQQTPLWPRGRLPEDQLLRGDNALRRELLLGGDNKLNQSLLLGGSKPIAEHLLLQPRMAVIEDEAKDEDMPSSDENDFEHLDYLETTDDMPLYSRKKLEGWLPRISMRTAIIAAVILLLVICAITVYFAVGGPTHPFGPADYRI